AHGVTYAEWTMAIERARQAGGIVAELVPFVWQIGLRAGAVPAHVKGNRAAVGYSRDDLTPAMRVEASGMREENGRLRTGALPYGQPHTIDIEELRAGEGRIRHSLDSRSRLKLDLILVWLLRSNHSNCSRFVALAMRERLCLS